MSIRSDHFRNLIPFLFTFCLLTQLRGQTPEMTRYRLLESLHAIPSLVNAGEYKKALPELNRILPALEPLVGDEPAMNIILSQAFYLQGVCNLELGNYRETVVSFGRFLTMQPVHPNMPKARLMMGEAYLNLENWSAIPPVIEPIASLRTLPPAEQETAFQLMSLAFTNLEKWEEALPYLDWLFQRGSQPEVRRDAASSLAVSLIRLSRYQALYRLAPRLSLTGANQSIRMNLVILDEGDRFLNQARPDLALLMYRMVVPYAEVKGNLERRMQTATRSMEEMERLPVKHEMVRQRYRRLQWEKTKLEEEAADLEAYPDYDLELRVRLGDVYHELERWEESVQVYLSVYEIAPESEIAERSMFAAFLTAFRAVEEVRAWEIAQVYMEKYPGGEYWEDITLHAATLLVNLERWFEAVEVVNRGLAVHPDHAARDNMLYVKAYAQFQQSKIRESITTMRTLLKEFPRSGFALNAAYWVALGHLFLEEYPEARDGFRAIVEQSQGGAVREDANYRMGVAEYGMGDFPAATRTFTDFLNRYPDSGLASEALSMIGDMLAAEAELDLAIDHYRRAVEKSVNMVQADYATFQQARTLELEKRWQEILELFDGYLDQFPEEANFTEATYWRGNALRQLGRREEALQTFYDTVVKYGDDPQAFGVDFMLRDLTEEMGSVNQNSGLALNLRERLQDEISTAATRQQKTLLLRLQTLQHGVTENPRIKESLHDALLREENLPHASPGVLARMGQLSHTAGQTELTQKIYEHFVAAYYESDLIMEALTGLAELRIQQNRFAEAEEYLRTVTDRFPSLPGAAEAYMRLGDVYRLQQKWTKAVETYTLVLSVKEWRGPLWPRALNRLGDTHREMDKAVEAAGYYERVYVLYSGYPRAAAEAYFKRAEILKTLGENRKAKEVLTEMLDQPELARQPVAQQARVFLMELP